MLKILKLFVISSFVLPSTFSYSAQFSDEVLNRLQGNWSLKNIPMQALSKGQIHNWTCDKLDMEIVRYEIGFKILKCSVSCGNEGRYNCITPEIHIIGEDVSYFLQYGKQKIIGSYNSNELIFRNTYIGEKGDTWTITGDNQWRFKLSPKGLIFNYKLFTSGKDGSYIEVAPIELITTY